MKWPCEIFFIGADSFHSQSLQMSIEFPHAGWMNKRQKYELERYMLVFWLSE